MKDEVNVVLTEEQMRNEERLNNVKTLVQGLFPNNKVEREGDRIALTATTEMFLYTELERVAGVCAIHHLCYYVRASVRNGLQAIIY